MVGWALQSKVTCEKSVITNFEVLNKFGNKKYSSFLLVCLCVDKLINFLRKDSAKTKIVTIVERKKTTTVVGSYKILSEKSCLNKRSFFFRMI